MSINTFATLVTKHEGLKKQVNIAQVKEVLRIVNLITVGALYKIIKGLKKEDC